MQLKTCIGTKRVLGCGMTKPLADFHNTKKWKSNVCAECRNKNKREQYQKSKVVKNITSMAWRQYAN